MKADRLTEQDKLDLVAFAMILAVYTLGCVIAVCFGYNVGGAM